MEPSNTKVDRDETVAATDLSVVDLENHVEVEPNPPEAPAAALPQQRSVFDRLYPGSRPRRPLKKTSDSGWNQPAKPQRRQQRTITRETRPSIQQVESSSVAVEVPIEPELNPAAPPPESARSAGESLDRRNSSRDDETLSTISLIQLERMQPTHLKPTKSARHRNSQNTNSGRIERIPPALVERTSLARGALPILPRGWAWICLVFNAFVPGSGTFLSGMLAVCCGAPRFSCQVTPGQRLLALLVNTVVSLLQAITVIFCLVGWCWSLGWGIILVRAADDYRQWQRRRDGSISIIAEIKEDLEKEYY